MSDGGGAQYNADKRFREAQAGKVVADVGLRPCRLTHLPQQLEAMMELRSLPCRKFFPKLEKKNFF